MFEELLQDSGLSLERLHTLSLMSQARGITEAARGDVNRQSQFSRQITELEAFFGVELLNRTSRPRRLTMAGQELAQIAQQSLAALDDFRRRAADQPSRLVIGAGDSLIQWLLLPKLPQLRKALPKIIPVFKNLDTAKTVQALQAGEIDLAFIRDSAAPSGMTRIGTWTHGHQLFIPATLLPRSKGRTGVGTLSNLPLAVLEGAGEMRRSLDELAEKHKLKLDVRLECSSHSQVALAIASGHCAGILPDFARGHHHLTKEAVTVHQIPGLERTMTLVINPTVARIKPWLAEATERLFTILNLAAAMKRRV